MRLDYSICTLVMALTLACSPAESQSGLTLEAKLPSSYGTLSNVVELSDGRVVFADTRSKLFLSADLKTGKVDTLGKRVDSLPQGAPAGHYRFPGWVAHLAGDTVALVDFSAIRTTRWNERGQAAGRAAHQGSFRERPRSSCTTRSAMATRSTTRPYSAAASRAAHCRPDSVPVLRIALKSGAGGHDRSPGHTRIRRRHVRGAGPAGRQGVCSQRSLRSAAGRDGLGGAGPGESGGLAKPGRQVDAAERRATYTKTPGHPGRQGPSARPGAGARQAVRDAPGSVHHVSLRRDQAPIRLRAGAAEIGEVWLQRPRAQEDAPLVYDVVNRQGVWQRSVTLPKGASLSGFGAKGAVYAAIKGEDGKRTVGKFRLQ